MVLSSTSSCPRDPLQTAALLFPKFSFSQLGLATYSLPHHVFVKARGISLRRVSDDFVEMEAWSEGCRFMSVFAWWYIGFRGWECRRCWRGKGLEILNDIAGEE
jgi:hypothetical protein